MSYKLTELSNVTDQIAAVLKAAGITDTEQLLMAATMPDGLSALAATTGLNSRTLSAIAERADLMRVKGIGPAYAELLEDAGISSVSALAGANSAELYSRLAKAAEAYGVARIPKSEDVSGWVTAAKREPDANAWATDVRISELRSRFAEDEWTKVQLAPLAVAALVISASPSGAKDVAAESAAAAAAVNAAKQNAPAFSLFNVAFPQGFDTKALERFANETPRAAMLSVVKSASALVTKADPEEAVAYRNMLMDVGEQVAGAAKEGGFLGMGKKTISDPERAVLNELNAALS